MGLQAGRDKVFWEVCWKWIGIKMYGAGKKECPQSSVPAKKVRTFFLQSLHPLSIIENQQVAKEISLISGSRRSRFQKIFLAADEKKHSAAAPFRGVPARATAFFRGNPGRKKSDPKTFNH
jgi:hypothetical protein